MNAEEFKRIFNLPFAEATRFFRDKLSLPTKAYDDIAGAAHAKAFVSAGAYQADLLTELRTMTDRAIAGEMDIVEFRKQFRPLVARYGWQLKGGGTAWRSNLIWRTNINSAYQAGRWQQFADGGIDYLKYVHNDGVRHPRPKHVAMDGTVLPRTDPFWSANYPANGWGCKCRAVAATEQEFNEGDKNIRPQGWETMADAGWDYNVGSAGTEQLMESMQQKMAQMPADIAAAWMEQLAAKGLTEWISQPD